MAMLNSPEIHAKVGQTVSATRMAWCPDHLRGDYRRLVNRNFSAAEARQIILDQWAHESARAAA